MYQSLDSIYKMHFSLIIFVVFFVIAWSAEWFMIFSRNARIIEVIVTNAFVVKRKATCRITKILKNESRVM